MQRTKAGQLDLPAFIPEPVRQNPWLRALVRAVQDAAQDNLSFVSGGVAFFGFLSVFPAIAASVMIWGRFSDPAAISRQLGPLRRAMPDSAYTIVHDQLVQIADASPSSLTLGAIIALVLAFWSAAKGARALIAAMNISYGASDDRGFLQANLLALGFTLGGILYGLVTLVLMGALPAVIEAISLGIWATVLIEAGRWILSVTLFALALSALYRFAPHREPPLWRWLAPGALIATLMWIVASWGFSLYVSNIADYNATFGALGSVAVLMFWMWISSFIICFGAVLNAELEPRERSSALK